MQEDREYSVYPSNLDVWGAFNEYNEYLKENKWYSKPERKSPDFPQFKVEVNDRRRFYASDFDEFLRLLKKYPYSMPLTVHSNWNKGVKTSFSAVIYINKAELRVYVSSDDLELISAIHDKIKECFHASDPDQEQVDRLSKYNLKKSIFLAHRFDDYGNSIAGNLNRFLLRLGFDVKEGSGYEAKDIPDKVREKIASQDIFICLGTPGDSTWIISEAATAKALIKYLIIICQEKVDLTKGIIGEDFEHLTFPEGFIEKCFSDLVYALPR
jgi:hypothetical protein